MSVYTSVAPLQLTSFLKRYDLGELIDYNGIETGIENSNYRLHTTQGYFILTLFEELADPHIQAIFSLLQHLRRQNLVVPSPQQDRQGRHHNKLHAKTAALFTLLPGQSVLNPTRRHCRQIGQHLAKLHLCSMQSGYKRENHRNLSGCRKLFDACKPHLGHYETKKISAELTFQHTFESATLPFGVIHADLFRDNVLWNDDKISGILDFYSSCNDFLLFDIAIAINDWCRDNEFVNQDKSNSLLEGYQTIRPLIPLELKLLPVFLRRAALRFWLSRLNHRTLAKSGLLTQDKDPDEFRTILEQHSELPHGHSSLAC